MLLFLTASVVLIYTFKNFITEFANNSVVYSNDKIRVINYQESEKYEGQWVKISLNAKYVFYNGKYLFISSMINPHHRHMLVDQSDKELLKQFFTIKILNKDLTKFSKNIEEEIKNNNIIVEGLVTYYQGDPHIELSDPKNLTLELPVTKNSK